jgi:hypothetical protein
MDHGQAGQNDVMPSLAACDVAVRIDAGGDPHAAVASVFSWSHRHLPPDAGRMFRQLGLHPAQHWDPYAAAALTDSSLAQARRTLAGLARAHLIQTAGPGRYQMHDLLRAYAASHDSDQARQATLTRLFDYYLATSATAADCLSPAHRPWWPSRPVTATVRSRRYTTSVRPTGG